MLKLSLIVPSIRFADLLNFISSLDDAINKDLYEVIIISPSEEIVNFEYEQDNIRTIFSKASPVVCAQLGILAAKGEFVFLCADDGVLFPILNKIITEISAVDKVNTYKYLESNNPSPDMYEDWYYTINIYPGTKCKYIPDDFVGMNEAIIPRSLFIEYGGFDCRFQTLIIATMDLAIRMRRGGIEVKLNDEIIVHHGHVSDTPGAGFPLMSQVQVTHDEPLFRGIYDSPDCLDRTKINIDNWKDQPEEWGVRR